MPGLVRRQVCVAPHRIAFIVCAPPGAADHPRRGIFHPLGAAFFSNATYTDTIGILNKTNVAIEPFPLAGARSQYTYNFTNGDIAPMAALTPQLTAVVAAEVPRYMALWNQRFRPISGLNYKVRPSAD